MNIFFVTGNKDKLREAEHILGREFKHVNIDLDEIQESNTDRIAEYKAKQAWKHLQQPVFVWDTSVHIDCLNGFPGPFIKWFWEQVTLQKICHIAASFANYLISTKTTIAYYDGREIKYFYGYSHGKIPTEPRGSKGWGWDSIFIPKGHMTTYAEMEPEDVLPLRCHREALTKFKDHMDTL